MSEFKIHHHASELLHLLGVGNKEGADGPEVYAEILTKNITPYVTTQVSAHNSKKKIAETSSTPKEFLKKYDELKSKNVRELDPLVYLLSKLVEDKQVSQFLEQNSKYRTKYRASALLQGVQSGGDTGSSGATMSQKELEELRSKLATVTSTMGQSGASVSESVLKASKDKQAKKSLANSNIPTMPSWTSERQHLSRDYVLTMNSHQPPLVSVGTLPLAMQELAVVEDLLFLMLGVEGKYILVRPLRDKHGLRTFTIDKSLDVSLQDFVHRILPVCSFYSTICRFIEDKSSFEFGIVNHALCAAMRSLMKEYMVLVAQLEHQFRQGQLSLQKFWYHLQPCVKTVEILASVAVAVEKGHCKGGSVLTLLHEKTTGYTGDGKAQDLCLYLTQAACAPYFETLEQWIYKGLVNDPYSEFFVSERESMHKEKVGEDYNDAYWEQRYTIVRQRVPIFLEKLADKILSTGKYLNVIRQCGRDVQCPNAEEIIYTIREREYVNHIEKAYHYASKTLLELLMEEKELMGRLRSIKLYFLMGQGDFFVHFMDLAEDEMKKNMEDIMPTRLENLLELALRTSAANADPFKDDLQIDLLPYDLITQLFRILSVSHDSTGTLASIQQDPTELQISGLEAFTFDYEVKWPVSLILSKKALTKYQMLFRHLFYAKHVERQLCNVWLSNKNAKQYTLHSSKWYAAAFALRQRMLHFVQNYEYYMMFEVLEPNWHMLANNLKQVSNIDGVLDHHNDFLDKCLKDCMLTNPELLKIVSKLMLVCVTFTNCMQRFSQSVRVVAQAAASASGQSKSAPSQATELKEKERTAKVLSQHMDTMISGEDFERTILNFDHNFSKYLLDLLEKLAHYSTTDCEHQMLNIISRLDHNGFYTEKLQKRAAANASNSRNSSGVSGSPASDSQSSSSSSNSSRSLTAQHSMEQLIQDSTMMSSSSSASSRPSRSSLESTLSTTGNQSSQKTSLTDLLTPTPKDSSSSGKKKGIEFV